MADPITEHPHDRLPKRQKNVGKNSSDIHAIRRMTQPSEKEQRELRQQLQQETAEDIRLQLSSVPETPLKKQLSAILTMIFVMMAEYERLHQEAEKMLELIKQHESFELNEEKKRDDGWWGRGGFIEEPEVPAEEKLVVKDNGADIAQLRASYNRLVKDRDQLRNQLNQLSDAVQTRQNEMYNRTVNRTDEYLQALDQRNNTLLRAANLLLQLPAGTPGAPSDSEREELREAMARVRLDQVNRAVDILKIALNKWIDLPEESRRLFSPAEHARMDEALARAYDGLDRGSNRGLIDAANILAEFTLRIPLTPAPIVTPGGPEAAPATVVLKTVLNSDSKRSELRAAIELVDREQIQQDLLQQTEDTARRMQTLQTESAQTQAQQVSRPAQAAGASQPPPDDRPSSPKPQPLDVAPKKQKTGFQTQEERIAQIIQMDTTIKGIIASDVMNMKKALVTDLQGDILSRKLKQSDVRMQLSELKPMASKEISSSQSSDFLLSKSIADQIKEALSASAMQQKAVDKITDKFKREEPRLRVDLARQEREMRDKESVLMVKEKQIHDLSRQIDLMSVGPAATAGVSTGVINTARSDRPVVQQHVDDSEKHANRAADHQQEEAATKSSQTVGASKEAHDNKLTSEAADRTSTSVENDSPQSPSPDRDDETPGY